MISKTGVHATIALAFLSRLAPGTYAGASQIADEVGAPPNYLGKLLKQLARAGLLESQKGFGGGFRLSKPAHKITMYDVLEHVDRVARWNGCFLGKPKCSEEKPCSLHHRWSKIREDYLSFLKKTTIAEVAR
jgi:Rrf2 family transcriptional regulator, iron-sulfur cluster assembly transcription factor